MLALTKHKIADDLAKQHADAASAQRRLASAWRAENAAPLSALLRKEVQQVWDRSCWYQLQWRAITFEEAAKKNKDARVLLGREVERTLNALRRCVGRLAASAFTCCACCLADGIRRGSQARRDLRPNLLPLVRPPRAVPPARVAHQDAPGLRGPTVAVRRGRRKRCVCMCIDLCVVVQGSVLACESRRSHSNHTPKRVDFNGIHSYVQHKPTALTLQHNAPRKTRTSSSPLSSASSTTTSPSSCSGITASSSGSSPISDTGGQVKGSCCVFVLVRLSDGRGTEGAGNSKLVGDRRGDGDGERSGDCGGAEAGGDKTVRGRLARVPEIVQGFEPSLRLRFLFIE